MEAAVRAEQVPTEEPKPELDLDALDAAAAAQDPEVSSEDEIQPTPADVADELAPDEFDRAVDS